MSAKYANLPDIDSAQDVYETPDVEPTPEVKTGDSSDDEGKLKGGQDPANAEDIDSTSLLSAKDAQKQFRKAEKRKPRTFYTFPPSDDSDEESVPSTMRSKKKASSHFERLLALNQELAALEADMANTSSSAPPQAAASPQGRDKKTADAKSDPAELFKGVHDVRARLERLGKEKDGRSKLVDTIVRGTSPKPPSTMGTTPMSPTVHGGPGMHRREGSMHRREGSLSGSASGRDTTDPNIAKLDSRVGELEKIVGSGSTALDEASPLPPPLLPMLTRLNAQMTILTQPRTIDSISRRLKLLLADLDKLSAQNPASVNAAANARAAGGTTASGANGVDDTSGAPQSAAPTASSALQEQLTPILQRLAPHLPTLPHILARLRTLSSLHAAAADFQREMEQLESQQARNRSSLNELDGAVKALEKSLQENGEVESNNVRRLESRVQSLMERVEALNR